MERAEALAKGLTRYSTGKPCLNGHLSERNTKSGNCLECKRLESFDDPDKAKIRAYKWRDRNPEKLKYIQWANNANMDKGPGRVSYADLMMIEAGQSGCRYCHAPIEELDHILPTKLGGTNWPWNIQFLCHDCNRRKAGRHPIEFEEEDGFSGGSWILNFEYKPILKSNLFCEKV